jgi:hypothetical protein
VAGSLCFVIDGARWGSWRVERRVDDKRGDTERRAMCIVGFDTVTESVYHVDVGPFCTAAGCHLGIWHRLVMYHG